MLPMVISSTPPYNQYDSLAIQNQNQNQNQNELNRYEARVTKAFQSGHVNLNRISELRDQHKSPDAKITNFDIIMNQHRQEIVRFVLSDIGNDLKQYQFEDALIKRDWLQIKGLDAQEAEIKIGKRMGDKPVYMPNSCSSIKAFLSLAQVYANKTQPGLLEKTLQEIRPKLNKEEISAFLDQLLRQNVAEKKFRQISIILQVALSCKGFIPPHFYQNTNIFDLLIDGMNKGGNNSQDAWAINKTLQELARTPDLSAQKIAIKLYRSLQRNTIAIEHSTLHAILSIDPKPHREQQVAAAQAEKKATLEKLLDSDSYTQTQEDEITALINTLMSQLDLDKDPEYKDSI